MPTPSPRWSLIQMSSDQVMQNILPALALRPERIVQIVSGRVRRSPRSGPDPMATALALAGLSVEFGDIPLAQSHPTHTDVFEAVHQAVLEERQAGRVPVVNLTGGSKLMGIGAFAGASQTEAPAVYVDTPQKRFVLAYEG